MTVDVLDTTGDPAAAAAAIGSLAAPGVVVGTITTGAAEPSGIEFPAAAWADAERFGQATGAWRLLRTADVPHVTVVLGADGLQPLLAALKAFPGLTCP